MFLCLITTADFTSGVLSSDGGFSQWLARKNPEGFNFLPCQGCCRAAGLESLIPAHSEKGPLPVFALERGGGGFPPLSTFFNYYLFIYLQYVC